VSSLLSIISFVEAHFIILANIVNSILMTTLPTPFWHMRSIQSVFSMVRPPCLPLPPYIPSKLTLTTPTVIIVGHTNCGGAVACLSIASSPPSPATDTALSRWLTPLITLAKKLVKEGEQKAAGGKVELNTLVEENVKEQVGHLYSLLCPSSLSFPPCPPSFLPLLLSLPLSLIPGTNPSHPTPHR
jgi:hypothetical protein